MTALQCQCLLISILSIDVEIVFSSMKDLKTVKRKNTVVSKIRNRK
jgi:hypothetical protein